MKATAVAGFFLIGSAIPSFAAPVSKGDQGTHNMLQQCQRLCEKTSVTADELNASILEARHSTEADKKETALAKAQKDLGSIKENMDTCIKLLGTMKGMDDRADFPGRQASPKSAGSQ